MAEVNYALATHYSLTFVYCNKCISNFLFFKCSLDQCQRKSLLHVIVREESKRDFYGLMQGVLDKLNSTVTIVNVIISGTNVQNCLTV